MTTTNDRIFINPDGSDNERRLASVEYFAILDAIGWLEVALKNGESLGQGLTNSLFEKVSKELITAAGAHSTRMAHHQSITDEEKHDLSMEAAKKVFRSNRENREKGLI